MASQVQHELPAAVLFDLDGTLLDSLPGIRHSALAAFRECGLTAGEVDLRPLIGPPIRSILERMAPDKLSDADLDHLVEAFRASYDSEGWKITPHYAGAVELLRTLQGQGRRLFVVSNKPRHISLRILEAAGTLGCFAEIVTKDSRNPRYADKREMMRYLLQKWELPLGECLMMGDTMEDAEAASDIGIKFCLMTHGYGDVPEDSAIPVAFRIAHFKELMPGPA